MAINLFTGAINSNWNNIGNWSLGTVPTATDGHVTTFDATSPNCTLAALRVCNAIDFTGYLGTITNSTFALNVSGNITLNSTTNFSGIGPLGINATGTITSNGCILSCGFAFGGTNQTYTLADKMEVNGLVLSATITNGTISGSSINKLVCNGGLTTQAGNLTSNADIDIVSGTWTSTNVGYVVANDLILRDVTIGAAARFSTGNLTNPTGTVTAGTSNLLIIGGAVIDTPNVTWFTVTPNAITLNSDLIMIGTLSTGTNTLISGAGTIKSCGTYTFSSNGTGTATLNGDLMVYGNVTVGLQNNVGCGTNGGNIYAIGNLTVTCQNISTWGMTAPYSINMIGTGTITHNNIGDGRNAIAGNVNINSPGIYTVASNRDLLIISGNWNIQRGILDAKKVTVYTYNNNLTLTNWHRVWLNTVSIWNNTTITMNEFFSGSAKTIAKISSSSTTTRFNVNFTDGFEKISKFIKLTGCNVINTPTIPGSLLVITDKGNGGFNAGNIRWTNPLPNGIPKNNQTTLTQIAYNCGSFVDDPIKI